MVFLRANRWYRFGSNMLKTVAANMEKVVDDNFVKATMVVM